MSINCTNKHVTPEIYTFKVVEKPNDLEDKNGLRPEVPAHLRIDSPVAAVIELAKSALKERLSQETSTLSGNYLYKLILFGLKRNLTLTEVLKTLNLPADDPRIGLIQPLYDKYAESLAVISLEEVQSHLDAERVEAIRDWNDGYKEQIGAIYSQVNPQNVFLNGSEWEKNLKLALDPLISQLTPSEYTTFTTFHRNSFSNCNLERLEKIAIHLGVDCDLRKLKDEIGKAIGPAEMRKKIVWQKNPLAEEMLGYYKRLLQISKEKGQPIDQHNPNSAQPWPNSERELIYIEEYGKSIVPGKTSIKPALGSYITLLRRAYDEIIILREDEVNRMIAEELKDLRGTFSDQEVLKSRFSVINTVLAEQEKHSFSRFYQLPYYFYSFAHTVTAISGYLSNQSIGSDYIETVKAFLRDPESDTRTPSYRKMQFMGRERIDPEAETELLKNLNSGLLLSSLDKEFSKELQRSHTLPYPGLFSWESSAFEAIIPEQTRIDLGDKTDHEFIKIKKDLFLSFKNRQITQEVFTEQVIQLLEKWKEKLENPQLLYHFSLLFLKVFYLRLFSESQLMPEVINQKIDKLSEWISGNTNYKGALRDALIALIDLTVNQQTITEEDAIRVLNDYYIKPIFSTTEMMCKDQSLDEPKGLFMLINATQVHQSMLKILRNPEIESRLETFWMEKAKRIKDLTN